MIKLGWLAPVRRVDAGTACSGILWQHGEIRAFLDRARSLAEAALDGVAPSADAVASAIGDLHSTLEVHLTFEEKVLLPLLGNDPPVGPLRAARLQDDHARQREMLATLHREASAHPELPTLAAKLASLTAWILADMDEEEASLLNPDMIHDEAVSTDQASR